MNQKTNLLLISALLVVSGCVSSTARITKPDGTAINITNRRFVWSTESYDWEYASNTVRLRATKASADAATAGAIAEGIAKGITHAAP